MGASIRGDHRFAKALAKAMARRDMTRAELARKLKVGRATVYGWLSGAEPGDANFRKLVRLFPELGEFTR